MSALSYTKTRNLEEIAARDPAMARQIEQLCKAVLALRGFAIVLEGNAVLRFAASATEPFVEMVDAFDVAMKSKSTGEQARSARRHRK